jgi:hypothetical protein
MCLVRSVSLTIAGHTFILSPFDYTTEWKFDGSPMICVSAFSIFDLEEDDDPKQIILGSAFLRKYYSIYDYDSKVVGCKSSCSSLITLWMVNDSPIVAALV